jgi:hypothetical protein
VVTQDSQELLEVIPVAAVLEDLGPAQDYL